MVMYANMLLAVGLSINQKCVKIDFYTTKVTSLVPFSNKHTRVLVGDMS